MPVALELASVMVSVAVSPRPIAPTLKALVIVGAAITVSTAPLLAGPAAPVSLLDAPLVVLVYAPAGLAVTSKDTWQVVAGHATRPPARRPTPPPPPPAGPAPPP